MATKEVKKCSNCGIRILKKKRFCSIKCNKIYWNKTHKEKIDKAREKFYLKFGGQNNYRDYIKKINPEKWKEYKRKQKLHESIKQREKWLARANDYKKRKKYCKKCGSSKKLEFHHTNYKSSLGYTLCMNCHRRLHNGRLD